MRHFAGIATAIANAKKNLNNARELFESYLQSVFENKGEGWERKNLEKLLQHLLITMLMVVIKF